MTIPVDEAGHAGLGGRAGARRAEVTALRAADVACDVVRATLDESLRDSVRPDRVIAVIRGGPADPLASAVADLGSAAFAAARAAHLAAELGSETDAARAAEVAEAAAGAAQAGAVVLARRPRDDSIVLLTGLAHSAAMTAHLAAGALEAHQHAAARPAAFSVEHPAVPFPASWRSAIDELGHRLGLLRRESGASSGDRHELIVAAEAACAAAGHALHTYQRSGRGTGVAQAMARVLRIAALAACYAGCAALDTAEILAAS